MPGGLPGLRRQQAGKGSAFRRHAPAAGRGGCGGVADVGGAGRGGSRAQEALGGRSRPSVPRAAWTRVAAAIPLARGRGEARPLAGRASVGQCVRARGAVSARRRAQPPPPNGHVGAQRRRRRLFFLILRTGLRGARHPSASSASAACPAASAAASSCPASGSAARCVLRPLKARPVPQLLSAAARGLM